MEGGAADDALLVSLRSAVDAAPDDVPLRLHLAALLLERDRRDEAVTHIAAALQREPTSVQALALMRQAMSVEPPPVTSPPPRTAADDDVLAGLDEQLRDVVPPMFVEGEDEPEGDAHDVEVSNVRLGDVGGMEQVKERLEAAFLAPMRNPELRRLYGKSLRGGLLLYGPPGCGKTFLARATAGELGARFLAVSLADILDMYIGQSERNVHELFETARRNSPCLLFLDEVDALGQRRTNLRNSAMRGTVNQLLTELDSVKSDNEGVFVLAATNQPWDVDTALRRPGRFDRMLLVAPPDQTAREAIFRYHLSERPVANVDLRKLAKLTDGFSGADVAHVCDSAAERALIEASRSGSVRMIEMRDLEAAAKEVKPSTGPWFETARNFVMFANESGTYDDLLAYMRSRRLM
ncbi:MAG TPA: ATP-binding protein [Mycobacteriales bacterium]|nr:ATP-binding protein [Mycobacteriales bacterium]